ncbi:MAG TPA: choice-of-anchor J domain-containing protein [Bacteroidales bacterium]|nr:choice-of-anchor J domain-containing protein [Bacteroidales bacterium]
MRGKYLLLILSLLTGRAGLSGQTTDPREDTASFPYWIEMMDDPTIPVPEVSRAFERYWEGREITRGSGWKPFKRWEYYNTLRMRPDGRRATNADLLAAWESVAPLRYQENSGGDWTILGPVQQPPVVNSGQPNGLGRLNGLAFGPSGNPVIYAAAASGGLWKTNDGGLSWLPLTDNLPSLGVSSILVDPVNPSVVLMGTGDRDHNDAPGIGVWKSTDAGQNWAASTSGMGNITVGDMTFALHTSQIILAATGSGIYRSNDQGNNWQLAQIGNFKDIERHPLNPAILYATASGKFYRSADTGYTWSQVPGVPVVSRMAIATTPAAPEVVYLVLTNNNSFNSLLRSTDAGLTFSERSNSPNIMDWSTTGSGGGGQAWYNLAIAADPLDPLAIYVGGVNVFKSSDGGLTWSINSHWTGSGGAPAVHADCHWLGYAPDGKLYAANDGGVYHTSNGGAAWTEITSGLAISQIYKIGQSRTQRDRLMAGYQDNGTTVFNPSGWLTVAGGDGMEAAVDPVNPSYTYGSYYYGDVYRLYNDSYNGTIAGNGSNGITEGGAWVSPYVISEQDPNTMFLGLISVWRSNNIRNLSTGTVSWTKLDNGLSGGECLDMENSRIDPDILYVSKYNNTFYRTDEAHGASVTFLNLTGELPHTGQVRAIETHPTQADVVYIIQDRKVFRSGDRGMTWTDLTDNLPDVPMSDLIYYARSQEGLYLGTDLGVFYRDNYTSGWVSFSNGLPAAIQVSELEIWYDTLSGHQDRIRAASFGRGVWESSLYATRPTASFTSSKTLIPKGCAVDFTDLSSGIPDQWRWSFPGAIPDTSSAMNPQGILYAAAGTFPVQLIVTNAIGTDSLLILSYIEVSDSLLPEVDLNLDRSFLCTADPVVRFSDRSDHCPDTWLWSFSPDSVTYLNGTGPNSPDPIVRFNHSGTFDLSLTVWNQNGSSSLTLADRISVGGASLPFTEDFEGMELTESGWTVENPDDDHTWTIWDLGTQGHAVGIRIFGTNSLDHTDRLISPPLNLGQSPNASLTFRYAYAAYQPGYSDSLRVYISDDCGLSWTRIFNAGEDGSGNFATRSPLTSQFIPTAASDWCGEPGGPACISLDLTSWAGKADIRIAFESYSYLSNNLFLDDIRVDPNVGLEEGSQSPEAFDVWPIPAQDRVGFISPMEGEVLISLTDMQGRVIYTANQYLKAGAEQVLRYGRVSPGLYLISLRQGKSELSRRISVR